MILLNFFFYKDWKKPVVDLEKDELITAVKLLLLLLLFLVFLCGISVKHVGNFCFIDILAIF